MPDRMARALAAAGHRILPLTDTMGFWGLVPAIRAAETHGLSLLAGMHLPLSEGGLLLYPYDEQGWRSICRTASRYHLSLPNCPHDGLNTWKVQGKAPAFQMSAVSAPPGSPAKPAILLDDLPGDISIIAIGQAGLNAISHLPGTGPRLFWGIPATMSIAEATRLAPLANVLGAPPVALASLRAASRGDSLVWKVLNALHANTLAARISAPKAKLRPPEPLEHTAARFAWFSKSVEGVRQLIERPTWHPPLGTYHMPRMSDGIQKDTQTSTDGDSLHRLRALAENGIRNRYDASASLSTRVKERLDHELEVIGRHGFADYFLLVHEIVEEAERRGHRVLGRGSAANSLTAYALRMTHVDPLRYGLFFERFLNPYRTSPPDIDLDFSWRIRDEIYEFLRRRWGADHVALISTHVTLGGRGAIRETGKALGFPADELNRISRAIGHWSAMDFLRNGTEKPESRGIPFENEAFRQLLTTASRIEGLPTHFSLHAGGIVVAPEGLDRFTPVQPSSKPIPMTQFEMHAIEAVGLVKIDLLSQRSLGVFADVTPTIESTPETRLLLDDVEALAADPAIEAALREGRTMGVFYIESPGMRSLLRKLDCRGFLALTAASSVIRPGVAESGMMQEYIARHRDPTRIPPSHPLLASVLEETHGVMIYQEDVIRVSCALAGFSLGEADLLRRAMSGKTRGDEVMAATRDRFLAGAAAKGVSPTIAEEVWRQIESFSGYAFCKAHSASYAVLSLQLLWMKCHHPARFMAAVLDNRGGFYGPQAYISEAKRIGCEVVGPDIDDAGWNCEVKGRRIMLGFSFLTGFSRQTADRLLAARALLPFSDLTDFILRVRPDDGEWEHLLDSGCLRRFGPPAACRWHRALTKACSLFSPPTDLAPPCARALPTPLEIAHHELKSMGVVVTGHPLDLFDLPPETISSGNLLQFAGKRVLIAGILIAAKSVITKKGQRMKFLSLEDRQGTIEVTCFPAAWKRVGHLLGEGGGAFIVEGRLDAEFGTANLIASTMRRAAERKK